MHRMASHTRRYTTLPLPRSRRELSRFLLLPVLSSLRVPLPLDGRTRINWRLATVLTILIVTHDDLQILSASTLRLLTLLLLRLGRGSLRLLQNPTFL